MRSSASPTGRKRASELALKCRMHLSDGHLKSSGTSLWRSFAPSGLALFLVFNPRLAPWATFWRRFAAESRRASIASFYSLICLLLVLAAPLFAQSWRIADFQDTISVSADGSTLVKERISLVFIGQWHGIHRTIPIEYPGPRGTNYTLFLDVTASPTAPARS